MVPARMAVVREEAGCSAAVEAAPRWERGVRIQQSKPLVKNVPLFLLAERLNVNDCCFYGIEQHV